ncbi:MAG: type II toxin-antitoxin system RelE/ParE family toxin [Thermoanaerobaculia bacterium]
MSARLEIRWSQQALEDLLGIHEFIARTSPRYADLTARRLLESVERLALYPESGRVVPELAVASVREVIHGSYRLICEVQGPSRVEVLTVFRGSRQFPRTE